MHVHARRVQERIRIFLCGAPLAGRTSHAPRRYLRVRTAGAPPSAALPRSTRLDTLNYTFWQRILLFMYPQNSTNRRTLLIIGNT